MHVAYLSTDTHSANAGGGIASYVAVMAEALVRAGHEVTVISLGRGSKSYEVGGVRVHQVAQPNVHWYFYRCLFKTSLAAPIREIEWSHRLWSALMKVHAARPIDVVEVCESALFWRTMMPKAPPMVVRGHGTAKCGKRLFGESMSVGEKMARRLELTGMRRARAVTAVSRFQAGQLAGELGRDPESIRVVANPINPRLLRLTEDEAPDGTRPETPTVLYTGRIEGRKGTLPLLQSVAKVRAAFPDVQYVIAGGRHVSIDDRTLEEALDREGIRANVQLVGHLPWQDLPALYRRASLFVMPSFYETFGISCIEAMAFGLPVVATRVGGLPEVVEDGVTGLLVPPGDAAALAEAIKRVLADPALGRRLGLAGRDRVRQMFTPERILREMLPVYEQARN